MDLFTRLEESFSKALKDFEDARNNMAKAEATVVMKELLMGMNMYADFKRKVEALYREHKENQPVITEQSPPCE